LPPDAGLTVVGSINLDLVARVPRLPAAGETLAAMSFERHPGGKGANQAVAAARLGASVRMTGCVGADAFSGEALSGLRESRVRLEVASVNAPTGVALILVDDAGETQIVVAAGANAQLRPEDVPSGGVVLTQLEVPVAVVEAASERAETFCLNAAPAVSLPPQVVDRAALVVVNRHELDALPARPRLAALTLGAEGAVLLEGGDEVARAAPPTVEAVDGTAAGDAFTAALVVGLYLEGREREDALRRACAAGALAASRPGAQPSLPTAAELDDILARA
jgi:ribokinase